MSKTSHTHDSSDNLHIMLDYLRDEIEHAETAEELSDVLTTIKAMLTETQPIQAVTGLPNIRAEVTPQTTCNLATNVPESLVSTFYDLSDKMNQLQTEDPGTFDNTAKALHWLANNDKCMN